MTKKTFWFYIFTPIAVVATAVGVIIPVSIFIKRNKYLSDLSDDSPTSEPDDKERIILHTDLQRAYLRDKIENVNDYANGVEELSRPTIVEFTWEGSKNSYQVYLSEKEDYTNSFIYNVTENKVSFTNLKIDTKYYFKVISGEELIRQDSFLTDNEIIRNMYVSGVTNVRDLGGYKVSGGTIRQGLIFRTGRLNENSTQAVTEKINQKGKETMLNEMKVNSEIDLRVVSNNEVGGLTEGVGVLGESVHYYQCPMDYNVSFEDPLNEESVRKVFEILGNSENYPTFFHCSIGTDRTGYIAWLINAVLGVKEGYLWRDYLFSNFGNIGSKRSVSNIENKYVKTINSTIGITLKEKANNYLLSKGIKQSQIDTLRTIMIEK